MKQSFGVVVEIEHRLIRPFKGQPREYFDQGALSDLSRSIRAAGQQVPITVKPITGDERHRYELVDGQRRWHAVGILKWPTIKAWVRDDLGSSEDQFLSSVIANFSREGHSPIEIAKAIRRIRNRPEVKAMPSKTRQVEAVAEIFGRSTVWVYQYESFLSLHPSIQALMHPERPEKMRLGFQSALAIVQLPEDAQAELAMKLGDKKFRFKEVSMLIRQTAREKSIRLGAAALPSRMHQRALASINTIAEEADKLLDMSLHDFERTFAGRPREHQQMVLERVERAHDLLGSVKQTISRMITKSAKAA